MLQTTNKTSLNAATLVAYGCHPIQVRTLHSPLSGARRFNAFRQVKRSRLPSIRREIHGYVLHEPGS